MFTSSCFVATNTYAQANVLKYAQTNEELFCYNSPCKWKSSLKLNKIFYNKAFSFPTHVNMLFDMHEEIEPDLLQDRSDKEI